AASPERGLFASQLKAFRHAPGWSPSVDQDAVVEYLRLGYVAQPRSIYREAAKLPPGHILTLRAGQPPQLTCFWDPRAMARTAMSGTDAALEGEEAGERLDALLHHPLRL